MDDLGGSEKGHEIWAHAAQSRPATARVPVSLYEQEHTDEQRTGVFDVGQIKYEVELAAAKNTADCFAKPLMSSSSNEAYRGCCGLITVAKPNSRTSIDIVRPAHSTPRRDSGGQPS